MWRKSQLLIIITYAEEKKLITVLKAFFQSLYFPFEVEGTQTGL